MFESSAKHAQNYIAIFPVHWRWSSTCLYEKDKKLTHMGLFVKAMEVFNEARVVGLKLDKFTFAGALNLCGQTGDLLLGQ
ncbi:hypothetical protein CMV_002250 [Castanea mollissima]|uniref:Uncharacterized protein n=1 Tax=Castanea mollissima TaxID=60419 RepID=A0A8J4VXP4_9ROSI|nr:hypothetical protein CMV_002250 [Castanea mollissima]